MEHAFDVSSLPHRESRTDSKSVELGLKRLLINDIRARCTPEIGIRHSCRQLSIRCETFFVLIAVRDAPAALERCGAASPPESTPSPRAAAASCFLILDFCLSGGIRIPGGMQRYTCQKIKKKVSPLKFKQVFMNLKPKNSK